MQIYLAKPGGQKEGPFTVEEINRYIAAGKYGESEFWAWHEGLPKWIPLYSVNGVSKRKSPPPPATEPDAATAPPPTQAAPEPKPVAPLQPAAEVRPIAERKPAIEPQPVVQPKPIIEPAPAAEPKAAPMIAAVASAPESPSATATGSSDVATASAELSAGSAEVTSPPHVGKAAVVSAETITASPEAEPAAISKAPAKVEPPAAAPAHVQKPTPVPDKIEPSGLARQKGAPAAIVPDGVEPPVSDDPLVPPFAMLEQIFVFTTGDGPGVLNSKAVTAILQETTGKSFIAIREKVPVDVVGRSDNAAVRAMGHGLIPDSVWRALGVIRPAVAQQAREGAFNLQLRTGAAETSDKIAALFLYRKPGK